MTRALFAALALPVLLTTSCISNHRFEDHDAVPNFEALEEARLAVEGEDKKELVDFGWIPLLNMSLDYFGPTEDALMREGKTLTKGDAYGPLFNSGSFDTWLFDTDKKLYEHKERSWLLWGLWDRERTKVRTNAGWRIHKNSSLLFGLLNWPTTVYVKS